MPKWKYSVDVLGGFGMGFQVLTGEVESKNENSAKQKIRRSLRKKGIQIYRASQQPISLTPSRGFLEDGVEVLHISF